MRRTGEEMADSGKARPGPASPAAGKALTAEQVLGGARAGRAEPPHTAGGRSWARAGQGVAPTRRAERARAGWTPVAMWGAALGGTTVRIAGEGTVGPLSQSPSRRVLIPRALRRAMLGPAMCPHPTPHPPLSARQINKIIETLNQQLQTKGRELNEFREKHNIRLMGEDDQKQPPKDSAEGSGPKASSAGVLVS
ncbi:prefoldin subunit 2 [Alligator sinensis]|uniref:Prefoldin subunit 2 n=1 Tax=Alligator sinensis TaxID=38654 RepID=A0A3Q0HE78_ALLSI|nr:prefoldin subunit 2 [Alligator sinensis]